MIRRDTILTDGITMLLGGIAFVRQPVVLRIFLCQTVHIVVTVGLGKNACSSNRKVFAVALHNGGVGDVDGFAVDEAHIRVITLDFQPWHIVLASDGYPFLCPTLAESEARLAEQREKDPLNIGPAFMATKAFIPGNNSFDDRAFISFTV